MYGRCARAVGVNTDTPKTASQKTFRKGNTETRERSRLAVMTGILPNCIADSNPDCQALAIGTGRAVPAEDQQASLSGVNNLFNFLPPAKATTYIQGSRPGYATDSSVTWPFAC